MYNLDFLIAALVFLIVVAVHFGKVKSIRDTNGKIYQLFLIVGIIDILLDILSSEIINLHNPSYNTLGLIVTTLLYIFQVFVSFCLVIYGISLREISEEEMMTDIKTWALCPLVMLVAVFANIAYGEFFYFDELGNYIHGSAYLTMYVYAGIMDICLGIMTYYYKKEISPYKRRIVWEVLFITVVCVILQALRPDITITGFGIGLDLLLMMFTINNPYTQTDNLTGKLDKNSMMQFAQDYFSRKVDFHIISINFSQLHQINTIFGSKSGDEIIIHVISRIDEAVKKPIFRSSGKRFVVFFEDFSSFLRAKEIINQILMNDTVLKGIPIEYPVISCAIESVGELGDVDLITHYVDYLYKNVRIPKNSRMIESQEKTIKGFMYLKEVEKYIPKAIEDGRFELSFQPIYGIKEERFVCAEVLSRLKHPTLGYVSPELFVDIAQKNDHISTIDNQQFRNACAFINEHRELLDCLDNIKFNVSPIDILKPNFSERRLEIINEYNLPTTFFQFEITETLATLYTEGLINEIKKLVDAGIQICMDDFGSGYANLNTVLKLPFTSIKIDRSLLLGIEEDSKKATLYKGTVIGFKNLGLQVISEGIENENEYSILKSYGVDMIQGYYFSRPLTCEGLLKKIVNKA